jgi:transaldolase
MKLFLDTAAIDEIRTVARWGILAGVTTNPSLFAEVGGRYDDVLLQICQLTPGPVSAEVVAADVPGMLREGRHFARLAPNIVVKVPMCEAGLEAIARLAREGIATNCTLIFSANQGLLAANAGASFLSPFVGRLDDVNEHGMEVVRDLAAIVQTHGLEAKVLAASMRHPRHVTEAALAGADIATVPPKILRQMLHHPLTEAGIARFRQDWDAVHARRDDLEPAGADADGLAHEQDPSPMSERR